MPNIDTCPMPMQSALISAISSAATNAPGIDPMPPTTTTTNALPIVSRSSDRFADMRGTLQRAAEPREKRAAKNTLVKSHAWLMPSAPSISRSLVAARTSVPQRVRVSAYQSATSTSGPITINAMS